MSDVRSEHVENIVFQAKGLTSPAPQPPKPSPGEPTQLDFTEAEVRWNKFLDKQSCRHLFIDQTTIYEQIHEQNIVA